MVGSGSPASITRCLARRLVNQGPEAGEHTSFVLYCSPCVLTLDPGLSGVYTPPLVRTPNSIA